MKLSDWAKKQGISYLTAYRWFKDGKLPIKAYQSDSGTIIVQDESENLENTMAGNNTTNQSNDIMSQILKKTVELSKNNGSIEDFAAYILSNFSLKPNSSNDTPRYSRNKPKPEEIQKHFQQFLKPKGEKPQPNNELVADEEILSDLQEQIENSPLKELATQYEKVLNNTLTTPLPPPPSETYGMLKDLAAALSPDSLVKDVSKGTDSIVNRIESTPQSINYTDSTDTISLPAPFDLGLMPSVTLTSAIDITNSFKPTQKEIESVTKVIENATTELRAQAVKSRRGRKSKASRKK